MKMKSMLVLLITLFFVNAYSQTAEEKPTTVAENMYILPKQGMEEKFEAAVKAHGQKFHPEGPYRAVLRKVEYGQKAGWYVWVFGPTTYASLDNRPAKEGGHAEDWAKTVDPLIQTYGEIELWNLVPELSYGMDILKKSNYYEIWKVDLKRGDYYRFKAISEKLEKAYESIGKTAFLIFNNPIHTKGGADVAILWSFDTYADWDKDKGAKDAYEKINGSGTWQQLLDEWYDILVDYDTEIRSAVK
jgi:hypothetical protein